MTRLWPEAIATGDAIAYAERHADPALERESYHILFPAYGTYVGGSMGRFAHPVALPIDAGAVVAGHAVGRVQARWVPDMEAEPSAAWDDIERLPQVQAMHDEPADRSGEDDTNSLWLMQWPFGRR